MPVLLGANEHEARLFVGVFFELMDRPITAERYTELLVEAFGDHTPKVVVQYPPEEYDTPGLAWAQVSTDLTWAKPTWELAHAFARHVPTYAYEFADTSAPASVPFPAGFPPGAYHSAEVQYQFDMLGQPAELTEEQWRLAGRKNRYWVDFARNADPNGADLPPWPRFDGAAAVPHVQSLAPERIGAVDYAAEHQLGFWAGLP